jgi:aspartate kinase
MSGVTVYTRADVARITLHGLADRPGLAAEIFGRLGEMGISVDLITATQTGRGACDVSFIVGGDDLSVARRYVTANRESIGARDVTEDGDVALVSVHVPAISDSPGVAGRMFSILSALGINIEMISASVATITCVVPSDRAEEARARLEQDFGTTESSGG